MAFCPDDPWVDADGYQDAYEDDWSYGGAADEDLAMPDGDQQMEGANGKASMFAVTGNAEWRGEHYRRHRRLKNPSACEDLRLAIRSGSIEGVEDVLNTCDDFHVDDVLRNGVTALSTAADAAQLEVMRLLLRYRANPEPDQSGFDCSRLALIAACNSTSANHAQVEQCVGLLISSDVDVSKCDTNLTSPLMYASRSGRLGVVRLLLQHGADVNSTDGDGWTALCFAAHAGHLEIVQVLLESGADPKSACNDGQLAEDLAFAAQHSQVTDYLTAVVSGATPAVPESYSPPKQSTLEDDLARQKEGGIYQYGEADSFLNNLSLSHVAETLRAKKTTLAQLLLMNEAELEEAGVNQVGPRMTIIEQATKTILAMWEQQVPDDDLKKRQILQKEVTDDVARRIMANLAAQATYASTTLSYLQAQLPGALSTANDQSQIEDSFSALTEALDVAGDIQNECGKLHSHISQVTEEKRSNLLFWSATGVSSLLAGGVILYYFSDRIPSLAVPLSFR
ncbi:ankyrin repeat, SAM and basic leucine zipper domain-containing protein 1-like [Sycon ciliatum]|uniref:ankyrin repeat, SAM and basic leucine zipper domain-containing protein 1-like n=1 Tax=Sycon ciliatum TaxID=27933 RepID=UPI0020AB804F|eukprot:scpid70389/ scgid25845/ Ankyrin repeat, SAM and basic leucine zipper domain-containing protein 1; Germ cell-specific ankyrin, SAM and basic leucine zipper domain-containing protein